MARDVLRSALVDRYVTVMTRRLQGLSVVSQRQSDLARDGVLSAEPAWQVVARKRPGAGRAVPASQRRGMCQARARWKLAVIIL